MSDALTLRQAWPLYAGMTVAASAAVVASASTLASLAHVTGWSGWTPWLLPAALDVGGSVGGWIWLRAGAIPPARRFGRAVAMTGAAGTLVGNAAGHLIESGYLEVGPALVVIVGAVPAAVLVALAHLAALMVTVHDVPSVTPSVAPSVTPSASRPIGTRAKACASVAGFDPVIGAVTPSNRETKARATVAASPPSSPVGCSSEVADTRTAVLDLVKAGPVTVAEVVRKTGRARTTVVGHLEALTGDGVVTRDDRKRYVVQHRAELGVLPRAAAGA
ncbi:winged helix-turn-helix domain-containing protein [Kineosporia sp. R_H_3]|uniref:winged helix-turn-helix domain-containing protein n=1 Tax=Kineosporia sp. R_H_3 TaxID=1961848 RepID=UPI000B4B4DCC|nr:winged helix-turn-helix domain-containing protein [Kineosporia sp. R_H_3]